MFDFSKLSTKYKVKKMVEEDAAIIFNLLSGNPLYFEYCPPKPSIESVLNDLRALPPGKNLNDKFYLGFFMIMSWWQLWIILYLSHKRTPFS